jgi:hypothetical protein
VTVFVEDTFTGASGTDLVTSHTGETGADWSHSPGYPTGSYELDGTGGVGYSSADGAESVVYPSGTVPADTPFYLEIVLTPYEPAPGFNYFFELYHTPDGSAPGDGFFSEINSGGTGGLWLDTLNDGGDFGAELPFNVQKTLRYEFNGSGGVTVKVDGVTILTDSFAVNPSGHIAWSLQGGTPFEGYMTLHSFKVADFDEEEEEDPVGDFWTDFVDSHEVI